MGVGSLSHDTTTSYMLIHTPFFLNFTPTYTLLWHKGAHICQSTTYEAAEALHTNDMGVGYSQWGLAASTMTSKHRISTCTCIMA